jgi:hypothetical protein
MPRHFGAGGGAEEDAMIRPRMRPVYAAIAVAVLAGGSVAQAPKPKDDPVADELKKAREAYRGQMDAAGEAMLAAFDKQAKQLEGNTRLKIEQQIKLLDGLKAERKAFEASAYHLPASAGMKEAVGQYKLATVAALRRCEKAFDTAAEQYRAKKDFIGAKGVLEAKQSFSQDATPFEFDGAWLTTHSSRWQGRRTVKADAVLDHNGTVCKWERKGIHITVTWPEGGWEQVDIDFKNPNQLKGITGAGLGSTWVRQKK